MNRAGGWVKCWPGVSPFSFSASPYTQEELTEKAARLSELNALLNMDEKETPAVPDVGEEFHTVADCPRKAVLLAGRVSDASWTAGETKKPSVLGKLKEAKTKLIGVREGHRTEKKKEQEL